MHGGMTVTTNPEAPLVVGLGVLYEDEPDGRVIAHIPQVLGAISRGDDRRAARAAVRGVLRDLIVGYLEPIQLPEELFAAEPLRLVIEP
jgi:predicted RNase H-like HicB family nuclease